MIDNVSRIVDNICVLVEGHDGLKNLCKEMEIPPFVDRILTPCRFVHGTLFGRKIYIFDGNGSNPLEKSVKKTILAVFVLFTAYFPCLVLGCWIKSSYIKQPEWKYRLLDLLEITKELMNENDDDDETTGKAIVNNGLSTDVAGIILQDKKALEDMDRLEELVGRLTKHVEILAKMRDDSFQKIQYVLQEMSSTFGQELIKERTQKFFPRLYAEKAALKHPIPIWRYKLFWALCLGDTQEVKACKNALGEHLITHERDDEQILSSLRE